MEQAIDGMTTLDQDAHTNYFDLEQAKAFSSSLEGSNVGLGISFYLNENKTSSYPTYTSIQQRIRKA